MAKNNCLERVKMKNVKHKRIGEGEVTGHVHTVLAEDAFVIGEQDERQLDCPSGTSITHEEYKTIEVPPGKYKVYGQKEIDPDTEEARVVSD